MTINYEAIFVDFLKNNPFKKLPPQEVIDTNKEVAKMVWLNYYVDLGFKDYSMPYFEWYEESGMGKVLRKYEQDVQFWEDILQQSFSSYKYSEENPYTLLLQNQFQYDYPIIAEHFLGNNDSLISLFKTTNNKKFLDLVKLPVEEKDEIFKSNILNSWYQKYSPEDIRKYQGDEQFILSLLKKSIKNYQSLSSDHVNYKQYTAYVLTRFEGFELLTDENKDKYFDNWLFHNSIYIKYKNLYKYSNEQTEKILQKRLDLTLLSLEANKFVGNAPTYWLENHFNRFIEDASPKIIAEINEKPILFETIKKHLTNFIVHFNIVNVSKTDQKIISIIEKNEDLHSELQDNYFYKLYNKLNTGEKRSSQFDSQWFEINSKEVLNDYGLKKLQLNEAQYVLEQMKKLISIEALKELQLPKEDIVRQLSRRYLYEKLEKEVPAQNKQIKKIKI